MIVSLVACERLSEADIRPARITAVGGERAFRRRLLELGFLPGVEVSLIGVAPIALVLLLYAYRAVPQAEATIVERAAAG